MFEGIIVSILVGTQSLAYDSGQLSDPFDERRIEAPEGEILRPTDQSYDDEHKICKDRWIYERSPDIQYCGEAEYLEQFEIEELKYVGHLEKDGAKWALISVPSGKVARIRVGDHIGNNHGKLRAIKEGYIVFTEIVSDGEGSWAKYCNYLIKDGFDQDEKDLPKFP